MRASNSPSAGCFQPCGLPLATNNSPATPFFFSLSLLWQAIVPRAKRRLKYYLIPESNTAFHINPIRQSRYANGRKNGPIFEGCRTSELFEKPPFSRAKKRRQDQGTSCLYFVSTDLDFALIVTHKYHPHGRKTTFSGTL